MTGSIGITDDVLRAFRGKPRTASEIADRLGMHVNSVGQTLARLAAAGRVRAAERAHGIQIWEPME